MRMLDSLKQTIADYWTRRRWRRMVDRVLEASPSQARQLLAAEVHDEYARYNGAEGSLLADFSALAGADPAKSVCEVSPSILDAFDAEIESLARQARASRRPLDAIAGDVDALIRDLWPNAVAETMLWPRERAERLCRLVQFVSYLNERIGTAFDTLGIDPNAPASNLKWLVDALNNPVGWNRAHAWQSYGRAALTRKSVQLFLKKFNWGTYLEQQWKTVLAWGAAFVFLATCVYRFVTLATIGANVGDVLAVTSLFNLPDQKDGIATALFGVLILGAAAFWTFRGIWRHEFQNALLHPERFNGSTLPVPDDAPPLGLQAEVFVGGLCASALFAFMHATAVWAAVAGQSVAFHFNGADASAPGRCVAGLPVADQGNGKIYLTRDDVGIHLIVVKDAALAELATHDDCLAKNIGEVARFDAGTTLTPVVDDIRAPISRVPPVLRQVAVAAAGSTWLYDKLEQLSNAVSFVIRQNLGANLQLAQQQNQLSDAGKHAADTSAQIRAYEELQQCMIREQASYSRMQRMGISKPAPQCESQMQKLTERLSPLAGEVASSKR